MVKIPPHPLHRLRAQGYVPEWRDLGLEWEAPEPGSSLFGKLKDFFGACKTLPENQIQNLFLLSSLVVIIVRFTAVGRLMLWAL